MKNKLRLLLGLTLIIGCSAQDSDVPPAPVVLKEPVALELFAARGSFGKNEFEMYRLQQDTLWRECGTVTSNVTDSDQRITAAGNDPLTLTRNEQRADILDGSQLKALIAQAEQMLNSIKSQDAELPPAASATSFRRGGVFELTVTYRDAAERVVTSVDAISEAETPALQQAQQFFAALRGLGPVICGSDTFYGVGRGKPTRLQPKDPLKAP